MHESTAPRIAFLCATHRGALLLDRLLKRPGRGEIVVVSFRETAVEPPFLEEIRARAAAGSCEFLEFTPGSNAVEQALTGADIALAVNWRYLLPRETYELPPLATYVFHDSLLPEYRGFSPTVWAVANGEDHTGATLFRIADDVDTGDIVDQLRVPIGPDDVIKDVTERVTDAYAELLERNLDTLLTGSVRLRPQDHAQATYVSRRAREDDVIDWNGSTRRAYDLVRALGEPYPGALTSLGAAELRVWSARPAAAGESGVEGVPGRVLAVSPDGALVATGDGALLVEEAQPAGGDRVHAAEVLTDVGATLGLG